MSRRALPWLALGLGLSGAVLAAWALPERPTPPLDPPTVEPISNADTWVAEHIESDLDAGVWPHATWRLNRQASGPTDLAFVYVHGFGACRAEGEALMDALARDWGANTLYVRLPGHGLDAEAHADARPGDYVRAVTEALAVARDLGETVVLVGSSTGGTLATWAAAHLPKQVDALVLTSPLFAFADPMAQDLLPRRAAGPLLALAYGEDRDAGWTDDPDGRKVEGYDERWLIDQKYAALLHLEDLRRAVARPEVYAAVRAPTLLLYHYADEQHQDTVVSVPAMQAAFKAFGGRDRHPLSRLAPIADGNHILTSAWVRTDKVAVRAAIDAFLRSLQDPPPRGEPGAPQSGYDAP